MPNESRKEAHAGYSILPILLSLMIVALLAVMLWPTYWKLRLVVSIVTAALYMSVVALIMVYRRPLLHTRIQRFGQRNTTIARVGNLLGFALVMTLSSGVFVESWIDRHISKGYAAVERLANSDSSDSDFQRRLEAIRTALKKKCEDIVTSYVEAVESGLKPHEEEEPNSQALGTTSWSRKNYEEALDTSIENTFQDNGGPFGDSKLAATLAHEFLGDTNKVFRAPLWTVDIAKIGDQLTAKALHKTLSSDTNSPTDLKLEDFANSWKASFPVSGSLTNLAPEIVEGDRLSKFEEIAIIEKIQRQDSKTTQLRTHLAEFRNVSIDSMTEIWPIGQSALRVRAMLTGGIQYTTLLIFWVGVFLIIVAIRNRRWDSLKFIHRYIALANPVDRYWELHRARLEDPKAPDPSGKDQLENRSNNALNELEARDRMLFQAIRGLPDFPPSRERQDGPWEGLLDPCRPILRTRTYHKEDKLPLGHTDEFILRSFEKIRRQSRFHHESDADDPLPEVVDDIDQVLRASASSIEFGNMRDALEKACSRIRDEMDNALEFCRYVVWLMPSIGFVGTILGIGLALLNSEQMVIAPPEDQATQVSNVTKALGMAFDTTLVALVLSIVMVLLMHIVQYLVEKDIKVIDGFIERHIIQRTRSKPEFDPNDLALISQASEYSR